MSHDLTLKASPDAGDAGGADNEPDVPERDGGDVTNYAAALFQG